MSDDAALRLLLFDRTAGALAATWRAGAMGYAALGRVDAWHGAASWDEGLDWLCHVGGARRIGEIQFWGHGQPGQLLIDRNPLTRAALGGGHRWHPALVRIRDRIEGPDALWWFRTCLTFGGEAGHAFARDWTRFFDCRAAGHTHVIGPFQPGLHALRPGEEPRWSPHEGVDAPVRRGWPQWMWWNAPRTITCLTTRLPSGV